MDIARRLGLYPNLPDEKGTASAGRARRAMAAATQHFPLGTFAFRRPANMESATVVNAVRAEARNLITIPEDKGQYYLADVRTNPEGEQIPVLVPEREVIEFVRMHYALIVADSRGLLTYLAPIHPRDPLSVKPLDYYFGSDVAVPPAGPYRYLVSVGNAPVLLEASQVITFICDQWALTKAHTYGVWSYIRPFDLDTQPNVAAEMTDLLSGLDIPTSGLYYHVTLNDPARDALIPLGDAPAFARGYALGLRHEAADELAYTRDQPR